MKHFYTIEFAKADDFKTIAESIVDDMPEDEYQEKGGDDNYDKIVYDIIQDIKKKLEKTGKYWAPWNEGSEIPDFIYQ